MAVTPLIAFIGSASANNGGMNPFGYIHEHAKGIDQCQTGEDFRNEVDRVLRILLHTVKNAGSQDVDSEFSRSTDRSGVRDLLPVLVCDGEGDGGHRCPYFPCPHCHRSRSIFVPESKTALMTYAEDGVVHQETLLAIGADDASDRVILLNCSVNDDDVLTCDGEGDGGHRCPYFPCPYCHRSRSFFITKADCVNEVWQSSSHAHVDFFPVKRTDDIQNSVAVLECPDKGHTCPYFPCPICHRDR